MSERKRRKQQNHRARRLPSLLERKETLIGVSFPIAAIFLSFRYTILSLDFIPSAYSVFHFKHSDAGWKPYIRVLCSRLSKRTFLPWTTERLKGERHGTHSLGQVCPESVFLTFLHSTPTLQAVDQPCFANALTGSRNARLSYGFRRKPTKSDFHFIRMSVLLLTPLQCISYARNP